MILEPDKRQGIVLINKKNYYNSLERLFSHKIRFEVANDDPTLRNISAVQNYLNLLVSRGETTKEQKKEMRPKFSQIGRVHDLPKKHNHFATLPSFRPIMDTTNTPHYGIDQFLVNSLNLLIQNEYSVKNSFEAVKKIHKILLELVDSKILHDITFY